MHRRHKKGIFFRKQKNTKSFSFLSNVQNGNEKKKNLRRKFLFSSIFKLNVILRKKRKKSVKLDQFLSTLWKELKKDFCVWLWAGVRWRGDVSNPYLEHTCPTVTLLKSKKKFFFIVKKTIRVQYSKTVALTIVPNPLF